MYTVFGTFNITTDTSTPYTFILWWMLNVSSTVLVPGDMQDITNIYSVWDVQHYHWHRYTIHVYFVMFNISSTVLVPGDMQDITNIYSACDVQH
jgi:hypothetical protein